MCFCEGTGLVNSTSHHFRHSVLPRPTVIHYCIFEVSAISLAGIFCRILLQGQTKAQHGRHSRVPYQGAKAKVRCVPEPSGICKRCRRLNKECALQSPRAHRRREPNIANLQVATLEQKLDRMVSMLAASHQSSPHDKSDDLPRGLPLVSADDNDAIPYFQEGATAMEIYSNQMVPLFPFVVIPAGTTPEVLSREKPFLYLAITMVACKNATRQLEIAQTVRRYLAEHIVMNAEHSLDLTQGLLVYIAWHHFYLQNTAQIHMLMHLALGQLNSLGLNQPQISRQAMSFLREFEIVKNHTSRTLEERRLYLGCYYLTSLFSASICIMESIRWTGYTEECCHAIEEASEYSNDGFLVRLVRLFQLADKIDHTLSFDGFSSGNLSSPLGLSIRWFQAELQSLHASFPPEAPQSAILLLHYHTVEIILYRVALVGKPSDSYGDHSLTLLDLLFSCLKSTKAFFSSLYSLPADLFPKFPYSIWAQFGHAAVFLSRLSLYRSDRGDWDRQYVRDTIDYYETCDELARKVEEARSLQEKEREQNKHEMPQLFSMISRRVKLMKDSHRRRQEAAELSALPPDPTLDPRFMLPMSFDEIFSLGQTGDFFN